MEHAQVYTLPSFCPFTSGHTDPPSSANGVSFAFCGISRTEPGHDVGPALRDHTIIHLVLSGSGELHSQGAVFRLKAHDGFIIRPDSPVTYQACATDPWTYLWLGLGGNGVQRCLAGIGLAHDRNAFHVGDTSAFLALIQSCFDYTSGSFADEIKLNAITLEFLHRLALAMATADGATTQSRPDDAGAGGALATAAAAIRRRTLCRTHQCGPCGRGTAHRPQPSVPPIQKRDRFDVEGLYRQHPHRQGLRSAEHDRHGGGAGGACLRLFQPRGLLTQVQDGAVGFAGPFQKRNMTRR